LTDLKKGIIGLPLDTLELTVGVSKKVEVPYSELKFRSRQKSKAISTAVNGKLCYLGSPLHKSYQAAYYCNDYLFQEGRRVTARFCKKRNCIVCARVYAAKLVAGYSTSLSGLEDLHMVTVTDVNVKADKLADEVTEMLHTYRLIYQSMNDRKMKIRGFMKLEITHSTRNDNFNPHIHMLISGRENAEEFKKGWLARRSTAHENGQNITKVKNKGALIEVFKYVTKAVISDTFDSRSLDAMYQAIHGRQVYRALGIKKEVETKFEDQEITGIDHRSERMEVWKWCNIKKDWYSPEGESFNNVKIKPAANRMVKLVEKSKNHVIENEEPEYDGPTIHEIFKRSRDRAEILF
jgi:hypothetical protein